MACISHKQNFNEALNSEVIPHSFDIVNLNNTTHMVAFKSQLIIDNPETLRLSAFEHSLINATEGLTLSILWKFENLANSSCWILLTKPLSIKIEKPIILDHSSNGGNWSVKPNITPSFSFVEIPAKQNLEHRYEYSLSINPTKAFSIIGQFGYSYKYPLTKWVEKRNWIEAQKWQQVISSKSIRIAPTKV